MDFGFGWDAPLGVFGFVILIILIGNLFSWLKVRAQQETLREAIRSGQPLDPSIVETLDSGRRENREGLFVGGLITLAAAAALVLFGWQMGRVADEPDLLGVMLAVAAFPALVGIALLVTAAVTRRKDSGA